MEIKDWVLAARKHKGWTQTQLGDELGLTKGNISAWEKGRHEPGHGQMVKIAELTGFPFLTHDQPPMDIGLEDLVEPDPPDPLASALALLTRRLALLTSGQRKSIAVAMAGLASEPEDPFYARQIHSALEPERDRTPMGVRGMSLFGELDEESKSDEKKRAGGTQG